MKAVTLMAIGLIIAFMIGRLSKNSKVFTNLIMVLLFGFVMGASIKSVVANTDNDTASTSFITNSTPTFPQSSPAVVWTDDTYTKEMSQDTVESDIVTKKYDDVTITRKSNSAHDKPEIQNDS